MEMYESGFTGPDWQCGDCDHEMKKEWSELEFPDGDQ